MFVMTISGPNGKYFPIDNKRILLITIKQIITSVQIRYNLFYGCANKLYDCWQGIRSLRSLVIICFIIINKIHLLSIRKYFPLGPDIVITNRYFSQCIFQCELTNRSEALWEKLINNNSQSIGHVMLFFKYNGNIH